MPGGHSLPMCGRVVLPAAVPAHQPAACMHAGAGGLHRLSPWPTAPPSRTRGGGAARQQQLRHRQLAGHVDVLPRHRGPGRVEADQPVEQGRVLQVQRKARESESARQKAHRRAREGGREGGKRGDTMLRTHSSRQAGQLAARGVGGAADASSSTVGRLLNPPGQTTTRSPSPCNRLPQSMPGHHQDRKDSK